MRRPQRFERWCGTSRCREARRRARKKRSTRRWVPDRRLPFTEIDELGQDESQHLEVLEKPEPPAITSSLMTCSAPDPILSESLNEPNEKVLRLVSQPVRVRHRADGHGLRPSWHNGAPPVGVRSESATFLTSLLLDRAVFATVATDTEVIWNPVGLRRSAMA